MEFVSKLRRSACVLGLSICAAVAFPQEGHAQKKPKDYSAFAFDADKRKRTLRALGQRFTYSGSLGLSHISESGLDLDAPESLRSRTNAVTLSLATRLRLTQNAKAFVLADIYHKRKAYRGTNYAPQTKLRIKEAHLSFALAETYQLTVGRLRFSDPRKRSMDAVGDGIHLMHKTPEWGWETALFKDAFGQRGTYALLHAQRYSRNRVQGAFGLFEQVDGQQRLHLVGYMQSNVRRAHLFDLGISAVLGDAANGRNAGIALDATLTQQFQYRNWKPHLTFGLAVGSPGYVEPSLASHKAKDGGQTQFHRFGTVFQPELTNLAIASASLGLRPSRTTSVDLRAHFYAQVTPSTVAPVARVSGQTNGLSRHVGHEISLVGGWRPRKSSKIEFGVGVFKPGRAYQNRRSAKRVFFRLTQYF